MHRNQSLIRGYDLDQSGSRYSADRHFNVLDPGGMHVSAADAATAAAATAAAACAALPAAARRRRLPRRQPRPPPCASSRAMAPSGRRLPATFVSRHRTTARRQLFGSYAHAPVWDDSASGTFVAGPTFARSRARATPYTQAARSTIDTVIKRDFQDAGSRGFPRRSAVAHLIKENALDQGGPLKIHSQWRCLAGCLIGQSSPAVCRIGRMRVCAPPHDGDAAARATGGRCA